MLDYYHAPARLSANGPYPKSVAQRLWAKVDKSGTCWLWRGAVTGRGYGHMSVSYRDGLDMLVHRIAWEMAKQESIPEGLQVLHTCDVVNCLLNDESGIYVVSGVEHERWGHLFLGTNDDNIADCRAKGRLIKAGRDLDSYQRGVEWHASHPLGSGRGPRYKLTGH